MQACAAGAIVKKDEKEKLREVERVAKRGGGA